MKKFIKTHYFVSSRSFTVVDVDTPESSSPVLVMISSISVPMCNHFTIYTRQVYPSYHAYLVAQHVAQYRLVTPITAKLVAEF